MVALVALLVAAVAFGVYLVAGPSTEAPPTAAELFVADLRGRDLPPSLRRADDGDLVALGERFCDDLRRLGSSLAVALDDQTKGRVYEGESQVVTAAQRHLCPTLPDRDRDGP